MSDNRAYEQAQAQLNSIVEIVAAMETASEEGEVEYEGHIYNEDTMREIAEQNALDVQVRSEWHTPGDEGETSQYSILLCTGGPAVRIIGNLGRYNEPEDANLQCQDWFTSWQDYITTTEEDEALLSYACLHWFGK